LKRVLRLAFQLLLLSFFLFIGHWGYARLLEDPYFRVREVEIEGCCKVSPEAVRSLIMIEGMPNLFSLRLGEIARRLERHPWIDRLAIRKVFPDKVKIQIEERRPVAILQLEELYYIDAKGVIFSPARDGDGYNFPFLTGLTRQVFDRDPEASRDLIMKALDFLRVAEREKVSPLEEISEIHLSRSFGMDCYTRANGLEVKMGRDSFGEKLRRLSIVWSDLQKRGLSVMSIDCSDLDRIVIKNSHQG
jgi:cell division septal protein FtsQ